MGHPVVKIGLIQEVTRIFVLRKWYQITDHDIHNVWHPEMIFNKVVSTEILPTWGKDTPFSMWFNSETHLVEYLQRIKVTFTCDFSFKNYPFDKHDCKMDFGTPSQKIHEKMNFKPIQFLNDTKGQELKDPISVSIENQPFFISITANKEHGHPTLEYNYPVTGITIHLKRNDIGLLISGFYVPTACFPILSLTSYAIDHEVVRPNLILFCPIWPYFIPLGSTWSHLVLFGTILSHFMPSCPIWSHL